MSRMMRTWEGIYKRYAAIPDESHVVDLMNPDELQTLDASDSDLDLDSDWDPDSDSDLDSDLDLETSA